MYSVKVLRNQKFKRKLIAISFALVLLAEFGEFFVPKNDVDYNGSHTEVPEHVPEEGRNNQVQKKPKPPTCYLHSKQASSRLKATLAGYQDTGHKDFIPEEFKA